MKVRNYVDGEWLPEVLATGFETAPSADPRWIFIGERDGEPIGIIITAPAHAFVIFLRLIMNTSNAEPMDCWKLLQGTAEICKQRGYPGYTTWLDPTVETERSLLKLLTAVGGTQFTNPQVACAGRM